MFNVDGKEFIFLVLIALVVLGPEKLPDLFRRMGKAYSELRRMSDGFQEEFRRAVQDPVVEVKATGDLIRESINFQPSTSAATASEDAVGDAGSSNGDGEVVDPAVHDVALPNFAGGAGADDQSGDQPGDQSGDQSGAADESEAGTIEVTIEEMKVETTTSVVPTEQRSQADADTQADGDKQADTPDANDPATVRDDTPTIEEPDDFAELDAAELDAVDDALTGRSEL